MRVLRVLIGGMAIWQGIATKEWALSAAGVFFTGMAFLGYGCCGVGGCHVNSTQNHTPPEHSTKDITYEEVH